MREFKFRAWDKKKKKYCYFDFKSIYGYEGETNGVILPDGRTNLNYNSGYGNEGHNKDLVIEQYVGFKVKNNKELFEGDIITDGMYILLVIYDLGGFTVTGNNFYDRICMHYIATDSKKWEVIGNINENKDLLK